MAWAWREGHHTLQTVTLSRPVPHSHLTYPGTAAVRVPPGNGFCFENGPQGNQPLPDRGREPVYFLPAMERRKRISKTRLSNEAHHLFDKSLMELEAPSKKLLHHTPWYSHPAVTSHHDYSAAWEVGANCGGKRFRLFFFPCYVT